MTHDEHLNEAAKLLGIEGTIPPDALAASWCEMAAQVMYELARRVAPPNPQPVAEPAPTEPSPEPAGAPTP